MTIWWLVLIIASILASGFAFLWLALKINKVGTSAPKPTDLSSLPEQSVNNIFNPEFAEELRNRSRLHLEKIISESAMFLQQDLRLTTSQLNEYMKTEITSKLQEEFTNYEQSINDAKQLAIETIKKTNESLNLERTAIDQEIKAGIESEKARVIEAFENNLSAIVNHYLVAAIGNQIDLNDQFEYILADIEANKKAIIEDIKHGS